VSFFFFPQGLNRLKQTAIIFVMNRFWTEKPTAVVYFLPPRKWRMSARYISSADYTNFWRKKRGIESTSQKSTKRPGFCNKKKRTL
jgi:hypothetical protein